MVSCISDSMKSKWTIDVRRPRERLILVGGKIEKRVDRLLSFDGIGQRMEVDEPRVVDAGDGPRERILDAVVAADRRAAEPHRPIGGELPHVHPRLEPQRPCAAVRAGA